MYNSILTSVKKMLGIEEEYKQFDADIIMHINSVFFTLNQLGVGPSNGFTIKDETATWDDYFEHGEQIEAVKSYMYLKVRLLFDPPQTSSIMEAMKNQTSEFEWRINVDVDLKNNTQEEVIQNGK